jgi:hypothetical protein
MISRFTVLCLVLLTIVSTFNGMYIQALGDISAAVVFECGNSGHSRRFFGLVAALCTLFQMRLVGTAGFVLAAAGRMDLARPFLSLHFGVAGIDDPYLSPLGRLASGAIGVSIIT